MHNLVLGELLTMIIRRVSEQSEKSACHVTHSGAAFTVCPYISALSGQAWLCVNHLQDIFFSSFNQPSNSYSPKTGLHSTRMFYSFADT